MSATSVDCRRRPSLAPRLHLEQALYMYSTAPDGTDSGGIEYLQHEVLARAQQVQRVVEHGQALRYMEPGHTACM